MLYEFQIFLATNTITLPVAFIAGIVSFFAPCVVPLLPAYISFVTGVSFKELEQNGYKPFRKKILLSSLFYILGFSIIFVMLGVAAGGLGVALRLHAREIQIIGGILMIIFGLDIAGVINIGLLAREKKFKLPKWANNLGYFKAFVLGIIFAAAWTPCIGPVLGAILALAATSKSIFGGGALLFIYALGISLPFLAISLTLSSAPKRVKAFQKGMLKISKIAGLVLVAVGVTLVFGWYAYINSFVLSLFI